MVTCDFNFIVLPMYGPYPEFEPQPSFETDAMGMCSNINLAHSNELLKLILA